MDEREILLKILREVKCLQSTFKRNDETNKKNFKVLTNEIQAFGNELRQLRNDYTKIEKSATQDTYSTSESDSKEIMDDKMEGCHYETDDNGDDDLEMPVSMKILAEVRLLKEKLEKSNDFNETMFKKLTSEVRALRTQLNDVKHSDSGSECETFNLPDMPFNSMTDFQHFNKMLANDEYMVSQLKKSFKRIDAKDYSCFIRTAIRKVVTDDLAINLTWRGTPDKPSIQKFKITTILKDFCKRRFFNADEAEINKVLQQHFLHAKDRVTKKNKSLVKL